MALGQRPAVFDPLLASVPASPHAVPAALVRALVERQGVRVPDHDVQLRVSRPLGGGQSTSLLLRFGLYWRGDPDGEVRQRADVILKFIPATQAVPDLGLREARLYAGGLWQRFPPQVGTPTPLLVVDRPGQRWLWLEDCADHLNVRWSPPLLAEAAGHLAALHGHFAGTGSGLVTVPWLQPVDWTIDIPKRAWLLDGVERLRSHPALRGLINAERSRGIRHILGATERMASELSDQPVTLTHNDAHAGNLGRRMRDGQWQTLMIDWPNVALAPGASELAAMVTRSALYQRFTADQRAVVERTVIEAYAGALAAHDVAGPRVQAVWRLYDLALLTRHVYRMLGSAVRLYVELPRWANEQFTPDQLRLRLAAELPAWEAAAQRLGVL
jgi:hypothetical protein